MTDARASPRATLAEVEALADQSVDEPDDGVARAAASLYRPERGQRDQCHPMRGAGVRDDRTCSDAQRSVSETDGQIPTVAEQARTREVDGPHTVTDVRHRGVGPDWDAPRDRIGHAVREQPGQVFSQRFGDLRRPPRSRQEAQHQLVAIRQPHGPRRYPRRPYTGENRGRRRVMTVLDRSSARPNDRTRTTRVGLVAAPELPAQIAVDLAEQLPELLDRHQDGRWRVALAEEPLLAGREDVEEILDAGSQARGAEGWDAAICLTDVPLRDRARPLVAAVDRHDKVAVVNIPAFGATLLKPRVRKAATALIGDIAEEALEGRNQLTGRRPTEILTPIRRETVPD